MGDKTPDNAIETPEEEEQTSNGIRGKFLAILLTVYIVYIVLGGVIFHFIEYSNEQTTAAQSNEKVREFLNNNTCLSSDDLSEFISTIVEAYDQGILVKANQSDSEDTSWDIASSVFFSTTIVTTVGYGNISPATVGGKVFAVFYAIIGIPLFIIASGQLGIRLSRLSEKATMKLGRAASPKAKAVISLSVIFFSGFIVFSLCASALFAAVEGWTYGESVYYTFITLTTIGFGDYYPSFAGGSSGKTGAVFYRLFVSVWIVFGLVWMASAISAVSDTMANLFKKKSSVDASRENESHVDSTHM